MPAWYRFRQALANLSARTTPEDWLLVDRYLSPVERALFAAMEPSDRQHSIAVLRTLLSDVVTDDALLKTALLHDVGKSRCRIGLFHRTVVVLVAGLLGKLPGPIPWQPEGRWWMPFYVLMNHPRIGASMLAGAGCEERVWRLTELHQTDPRFLGEMPDRDWLLAALSTLRSADSRN